MMNYIVFFSSLIFSLILIIPLGTKWLLDKKIIIPGAFLIGIFCAFIIQGILKYWNLNILLIFILEILTILFITVFLLLWRFYRDPERVPPQDENAILSPADGSVIYIKKIEGCQIPYSEKNGKKFLLKEFVQSDLINGDGHLVGISMNFLDVHVNRAPITGKIAFIKHIKGLFISLKQKKAIVRNERVLTIIQNDNVVLGIVQIASRLVRNIVPYVSEGEFIQKGERIGMIRFGSQVDIIIPDSKNIQIKVNPKTKVKAGVSVIATLNKW
jgi:phosphatidylserine decarboxylase